MSAVTDNDKAATTSENLRARRWTRWSRRVLLVVACVSLVLSVALNWVQNQVEDTDRYVRTVSPLGADPAIQNAIVTAVTDHFSARLDEATTRDTLGDRERYLAAPVNQLLTDFVDQTVRSFVASEEFARYWVEINQAAHPAISAILTGSSTEVLTSSDGKVTVDLAPIVAAISTRLNERGIDVFDRAPSGRVDVTIVLVDSAELADIQGLIELLDSLALVFPILALVTLIGYLWLSDDRRRGVIWAGLGVATAMAIFLLLLTFARARYVDGLSSDVNREAATAFFDILGRYLRASARLITAVGLLVAGVAVVTRPGGWLRRQVVVLGGYLAPHRIELTGVLIACCCIAVVAPDRIGQGWARAIAVIAIAGLVAIWLFSRAASLSQPGPTPSGPASAVSGAGGGA